VTFWCIWHKAIERTRKQDAQKKAIDMGNCVNHIEMSNNVLVMDSLCFREWARLMAGTTTSWNGMIAATARVR
jgi:hypothetical protein